MDRLWGMSARSPSRDERLLGEGGVSLTELLTLRSKKDLNECCCAGKQHINVYRFVEGGALRRCWKLCTKKTTDVVPEICKAPLKYSDGAMDGGHYFYALNLARDHM